MLDNLPMKLLTQYNLQTLFANKPIGASQMANPVCRCNLWRNVAGKPGLTEFHISPSPYSVYKQKDRVQGGSDSEFFVMLLNY